MRLNIIGLLFGIAFGGVLAASNLHEYDTIHETLKLESPYVFGLMGLAIGISLPLLWILERRQVATVYGGRLALSRSKIERHHIVGGVLFGAGWSIAGTCPAPALAMLSSGATETVQRIFRNVVAALDGDLLDRICHVLDSDHQEPFGDIFR